MAGFHDLPGGFLVERYPDVLHPEQSHERRPHFYAGRDGPCHCPVLVDRATGLPLKNRLIRHKWLFASFKSFAEK